MTSSTALAVFGSVDETSNTVSAADLSTAVLNLFPWESLFVVDLLKKTKYYTLCECKLCVVLVRSS